MFASLYKKQKDNNMQAIFPGSFDPFTLGHYEIATRASKMFDLLYIAVGFNINKHSFIDIDRRVDLIRDCFPKSKKIKVISYDALTVELCKTLNVSYLVHGLRNAADFEYERQIAETNRLLDSGIENINLICSSRYSHISSSVVRELHSYGADISKLMPKGIVLDNYL